MMKRWLRDSGKLKFKSHHTCTLLPFCYKTEPKATYKTTVVRLPDARSKRRALERRERFASVAASTWSCITPGGGQAARELLPVSSLPPHRRFLPGRFLKAASQLSQVADIIGWRTGGADVNGQGPGDASEPVAFSGAEVNGKRGARRPFWPA